MMTCLIGDAVLPLSAGLVLPPLPLPPLLPLVGTVMPNWLCRMLSTWLMKRLGCERVSQLLRPAVCAYATVATATVEARQIAVVVFHFLRFDFGFIVDPKVKLTRVHVLGQHDAHISVL